MIAIIAAVTPVCIARLQTLGAAFVLGSWALAAIGPGFGLRAFANSDDASKVLANGDVACGVVEGEWALQLVHLVSATSEIHAQFVARAKL